MLFLGFFFLAIGSGTLLTDTITFCDGAEIPGWMHIVGAVVMGIGAALISVVLGGLSA